MDKIPKLPPLVPDRLARNKHYPLVIHFLRLAQFGVTIISVGLFARYMVTLGTAINSADGAVIGILIANGFYTILAAGLGCLVPMGATLWRLLVLLLDLAFIAAFIGVAALTSPGKGLAATCPPGDQDGDNNINTVAQCNLVSGTFALSIISILLHGLSLLLTQGNIDEGPLPVEEGGKKVEASSSA